MPGGLSKVLRIPSKLDIQYGLLASWVFGTLMQLIGWLASLLWLSFQPNQMQSFNSSSSDGQSTGLPPTVASSAQPDVSEYSLRPEDYNSCLQTSETCPWPSKAFISLVACDQITQSVLVAYFLFAMLSYLIYCLFFSNREKFNVFCAYWPWMLDFVLNSFVRYC